MEARRVIACALLAFLAGYVGIALGERRVTDWRMTSLRVWRATRRLASRVGQTPVAHLLRGLGPVGRLCDEASRRFARSGSPMLREDVSGLLVCLIALSCVVCVLLARSLVGLLLPCVAWGAGLPLVDSALVRRRAHELSSEMPGVFRTLAMAMGSGETLAQAITYVGEHERGLAGEAFRTASLKLRCGMTAQDALGDLVADLDAPGVGLLATALLISQRTGSPLMSLFQRSAGLVERQGEFERMLEVKTAQVRLSVRIVSLLPVVMLATLSLISPDFQRGLATPVGMGCVLVAALMDGLALAIIRRLMKGVL